MRFKGTLALLILCAGLGLFLYFYEIKGGEQRTQEKQTENQVWKVPVDDVQELDLVAAGEHIAGVRSGNQQWEITVPRALEADTDEWNRLAGSAADISKESVVDENASSLEPFGLEPPQTSVSIKTKDGTVHEIMFGVANPTGSSVYAAVKGSREVFLVTSYVAGNFNKKLDDLRNHAILSFDQYDTQSLDLKSASGTTDLVKENDRWWLQDKHWAADSSSVNAILGDLANGRIKEFFEENPDDYTSFGFDKPLVDVRLTLGKDKAIKHLAIGMEKSKLVKKGQSKAKPEPASSDTATLYVARDDSRPEMFFVDKEFVDKLLKSPSDLRDKILAAFTRWDIDAITLTNSNGTINLAKSEASDWTVGDEKKKAKSDAAGSIFDALDKPVKDFVDQPGPLSKYGLDSPSVHVELKQGGKVMVDAIFGNQTSEGVYAQIKGEPYLKIADTESIAPLKKAEADFLEPEAEPAPAAPKK